MMAFQELSIQPRRISACLVLSISVNPSIGPPGIPNSRGTDQLGFLYMGIPLLLASAKQGATAVHDAKQILHILGICKL